MDVGGRGCIRPSACRCSPNRQPLVHAARSQ